MLLQSFGEKSTLLAVFTVATSILMAGCGPPTPPTFSVTGVVTLDGDPVEGANVNFVADGEHRSAVGVTDAAGNYSLKTEGGYDGAMAGDYKIKITKFGEPAPQPPQHDEESSNEPGECGSASEDSTENVDGEATPAAESTPAGFPQKYRDVETSGLTRTVKPEANVINFELSRDEQP